LDTRRDGRKGERRSAAPDQWIRMVAIASDWAPSSAAAIATFSRIRMLISLG
jgi:hypothetical protein